MRDIIGQGAKRDAVGADEDGLHRHTASNANMNPKQHLLEVEREQGANRKSFQVDQQLSLEREKESGHF